MKIVCNLAVRTVAMFAFQIYQYDGYKEKTREELARLSQGKVIDWAARTSHSWPKTTGARYWNWPWIYTGNDLVCAVLVDHRQNNLSLLSLWYRHHPWALWLLFGVHVSELMWLLSYFAQVNKCTHHNNSPKMFFLLLTAASISRNPIPDPRKSLSAAASSKTTENPSQSTGDEQPAAAELQATGNTWYTNKYIRMKYQWHDIHKSCLSYYFRINIILS